MNPVAVKNDDSHPQKLMKEETFLIKNDICDLKVIAILYLVRTLSFHVPEYHLRWKIKKILILF